MENRFRLFCLVLYKESDSYSFSEVIKNIKSYKYYAYCCHDSDLDDTGIPKKIHYHFVIKLDNASTIDALSKKIGVPKNYIQNIRNERAFIRYLIHFDDDDKFQYNLDDIVVSRSYKRYVSKCFDDKETEEEIIDKIYEYILNELVSLDYKTALFNLIKYVNYNCYDTIYKRYRFEILEFLKLNIS